jgi:hypothetical protein
LGINILKFLFFPGLLFLAACGGLLLFMEGWIQAAFCGGGGPRFRDLVAGEALKATLTPGELTALIIELAAMGVAGVLLVGVRGDLFVLVLLLSAAEILPLLLLAMQGLEQSLHVPLLFRTALYRMVALSCIALSMSLRFPEAFSPGLETLRGEGAPQAAQLWSGLEFGFIVASIACTGLAFFLFLLGRPAHARLSGTEREDPSALVLAAVIDGPQRAVSLILCVVLFLGYPWEGGMGELLWSAAALGTVMLVSVARAWIEGRASMLVGKLQTVACVFAVTAVALAFTAVILYGSWG